MAGKLRTARATAAFPSISINTYAQLLKQEPAILKRIAETPNGGNFFMAHPFQLLSDIGVVLSKEVQRRILKAAGAQSVRYDIHGLFRRQ